MTNKFDVALKELNKINDMPGTWEDSDYHALLESIEIEGLEVESGEDLLEVTLMALQDLKPNGAADTVLSYKLRDIISAGIRQNIVQDLIEGGRPWEEYSNIDLHKSLFAVSVLLHKTFPLDFVKPDMLCLTLQLETDQPEAQRMFCAEPEPAFVTRILADGMNESSILERLFEDQLASESFPEARGIIWHAEYQSLKERDPSAVILVIYSSSNWLKPMEDVDTFASCAYNDKTSAC